MWISLPYLPKGYSVHDEHMEIEQDQARRLLTIAKAVEGFSAIRDARDTIARDLKVARHQVDHSLLVLDNQDVACRVLVKLHLHCVVFI
jgi:hypothetical protein